MWAVYLFAVLLLFYLIFLWWKRVVFIKYKPRKFDFSQNGKPIIIGHRGVPTVEIENSLPCFQKMNELNVLGTEFDAELTKDGQVVVYHDLMLKRFFGKNARVEELTLDEIKKFELICVNGEKTSIPTLDEALVAMKDCKFINIELKSDTFKDKGLEAKVSDLIKKHHFEERVLVSSFNPFSLNRFRKVAAEIPRGLLVSPNDPIYLRKFWFWFVARPDFLNLHIDYISGAVVKKFKKRGLGVNYWCVDNFNVYQQSLKDEPAVIISNVPQNLK